MRNEPEDTGSEDFDNAAKAYQQGCKANNHVVPKLSFLMSTYCIKEHLVMTALYPPFSAFSPI